MKVRHVSVRYKGVCTEAGFKALNIKCNLVPLDNCVLFITFVGNLVNVLHGENSYFFSL